MSLARSIRKRKLGNVEGLMLRSSTLITVLLIAAGGCAPERSAAQSAPTWQAGAWLLDDPDLHNPYLVLDADGRARFQNEAGDDPGEIGAAGEWSAEGARLSIALDEFICCQFVEATDEVVWLGDGQCRYRGRVIPLIPVTDDEDS